ncbi:MAG: tyrosine-type recombinase/integrase [Solirubrobacteraceae bacterium]
MSPLRQALADYLQIRRRLGYSMPQDSRLLEQFVAFMERAGAGRITTELALEWARQPADTHPHYWRQRLTVVRGFARHLATLDPASEVPSSDLLPAARPRLTPHIYTDQEIAALIEAAGELRPPLRAARHVTLIGLLAVTGMRPCEALALDRRDVDLNSAVVLVRSGKQHKQREVPLHDSTVLALRNYARLRDALLPAPSTSAFFISARGRRMGRSELNQTFTQLVREAGVKSRGARARPRPHDLRHALACRTLLGWLEAGEDVDRLMPLLSTFLGHVSPASTYWYLEAVPELMQRVSHRLGQLGEVL